MIPPLRNDLSERADFLNKEPFILGVSGIAAKNTEIYSRPEPDDIALFAGGSVIRGLIRKLGLCHNRYAGDIVIKADDIIDADFITVLHNGIFNPRCSFKGDSGLKMHAGHGVFHNNFRGIETSVRNEQRFLRLQKIKLLKGFFHTGRMRHITGLAVKGDGLIITRRAEDKDPAEPSAQS